MRCPFIICILGRGGFEALPTSTALYFKGIHDCAPTIPQANFSFILYIFFSILRVKSSPYPVRDSKPINEPLKAFILKAFSVFCPNAVQKNNTLKRLKGQTTGTCLAFFIVANKYFFIHLHRWIRT